MSCRFTPGATANDEQRTYHLLYISTQKFENLTRFFSFDSLHTQLYAIRIIFINLYQITILQLLLFYWLICLKENLLQATSIVTEAISEVFLLLLLFNKFNSTQSIQKLFFSFNYLDNEICFPETCWCY